MDPVAPPDNNECKDEKNVGAIILGTEYFS